jgi:site-specific DNA recombinase
MTENTAAPPQRAVGYIRVSTEEQKRHGWNLAEDRSRIEATIAERGWIRHAIYDDGGRQGDDPDRPFFLQMLDEVDRFDVLIVRDLDRFSRKLAIYATAVDTLIDAGVKLYEFDGDDLGLRLLDLSDEDDRALADIKAVFAQMEKGKIKRRVRQAMTARTRNGNAHGPTPYGYRRSEGDHGDLVKNPAEATIVERLFRECLSGKSQRQMARDLNAEGIPPQRAAEWNQGTIGKLLQNPVYVGKVRINGETYNGLHEAIVDDETWAKAEQMRNATARTIGGGRGRKPTGGHLLTKGMLKCGYCGSAMIPVTKPTHTPGSIYTVYSCFGRLQKGKDSCPQTPVQRTLIDGAVFDFFSREGLDHDGTKLAVLRAHRAKLDEFDTLRQHAEAEAHTAAERLARVRRHYQDGKLDPEDWAEQREQLTEEHDAAEAQVKQYEHKRETLFAEISDIDAETAVLEELAAMRQLVTGEAQERSREGVDAFRAALLRLFSCFELRTDSHGFSFGIASPEGSTEWVSRDEARDVPTIKQDGRAMSLIPHVRNEALRLDDVTFPALHRAAMSLSRNDNTTLQT